MILETMTIAEVARVKGVSERAVQFVLADPENAALRGVRCGKKVLVIAESVSAYEPRAYRGRPGVKPRGPRRKQPETQGQSNLDLDD